MAEEGLREKVRTALSPIEGLKQHIKTEREALGFSQNSAKPD